jgi:hypothetical protein
MVDLPWMDLQVDFLMVVIDASWESLVAVVVVGFSFVGTGLLAMMLALL